VTIGEVLNGAKVYLTEDVRLNKCVCCGSGEVDTNIVVYFDRSGGYTTKKIEGIKVCQNCVGRKDWVGITGVGVKI
jgi:hypothetical protein